MKNFIERYMGENLLLINNKNSQDIIELNKTASEIYYLLKNKKSENEIIDIFIKKYNSEKVQVVEDIKTIITDFKILEIFRDDE